MNESVDFRLTARNETKAAFDEAKRGLNALGESVASARAMMASLSTAIGAAAFAKLISDAAETTARYKDLGEIAGTTASKISGFEVPARLAGKSLDDVAGSIAKLSESIGAARLGDADKASLLQALGIDPDDGRDAADVYADVARSLVSMTDKTVQAKVAKDLLGKSFAELRPFLNELVAAGELNARVTDAQAEAADRYGDTLAQLSLQVERHKLKLAGDLLPVLVDIAEGLNTVAGETQALEVAGQAGVVFFQTVAVVGANVAFVLQGVGREAGAIGAQLTALARLDFKGFAAIGDAVKEDAARARAELDAFEKRIMSIGQVRPDMKDNFDFFGAGGNPLIKGLKSDAEEAVKARMKFEEEYRALITQAQGFADRYAAAIKSGNALLQEARKQGQLSEVELVRATAANEDARLQVQIQALQKQEAIYKRKGDLQQAAAAREKILAAEAEREAAAALAKARTDSLQLEDDAQWRQNLAIKVARIQEENLTELQLLEAKLVEKQIIIDMAAQQGFISDEVWQKLSFDLYQGFSTAKYALSQKELQREMAKHSHLRNMEIGTWQLGSNLLQMFAGESKEAALLVIGINKSLAIAQTIQATSVAVMRAFADLGPIAGAPVAASMETLGAVQVGLITATGLAEAASVGGGSATPVFSANPSTGLPALQLPSSVVEPPLAAPLLPAGAAPAPRSEMHITIIGKPDDKMELSTFVEEILPLMKQAGRNGAFDVEVDFRAS